MPNDFVDTFNSIIPSHIMKFIKWRDVEAEQEPEQYSEEEDVPEDEEAPDYEDLPEDKNLLFNS